MDVGEAPQAPRRLGAGFGFGKAQFHFGQPDAAVGGKAGDLLAGDAVVEVGETVERTQRQHDTGLFVLDRAPERTVDVGCDLASIGNGVDQVAGAVGGIACSPHLGERCRHGLVVDVDGAPRRQLGAAIPAQCLDVDRLADGDDHRVGCEGLLDAYFEGGGKATGRVENRKHLHGGQPGDPAIGHLDALRTAPVDETNALAHRLFDLEAGGGHLLGALQRHHGDLLGSGTHRRTGHVHGLGDLQLPGGKVDSGGWAVPVGGGPQGGPGSVHGDVASTDHHDLLSHLSLVALVDVDQELDRLEHPVRLVTRDVEPAPQGGPEGQHHAVMALAEFFEGDIPAEAGVHLHLDAEGEDRIDLRLNQGPVEAVLGDAEDHHPAEDPGGLVDRHLIAPQPQVVSGGQAGRSAADDPDRLLALGAIRGGHRALIARLRPVLLGDETLQGPNGDGAVHLAAPTGSLTGGGAYPAADAGERVGEACSEVGGEVVAVGDGGHVGAGVGVDRTRRQAGDVAVVVGQIELQAHQTSPLRCARRSPTIPTTIAAPHTALTARSRSRSDPPETKPRPRTKSGSHTVNTTK